MNRRRHVAQLLADYPNALRFRVRAARDWAVPPAFASGERRPVVILPGASPTSMSQPASAGSCAVAASTPRQGRPKSWPATENPTR